MSGGFGVPGCARPRYDASFDDATQSEIMRRTGYNGYVSLEFEGNESPDTAIPKSLALFRRAFAAAAPTE